MDSNNRRILLNTVFLYMKLIINMVVSFVSARLVLSALGAEDYGLYNVVAGFVVMLNMLGTSMVATSYRYMAVEIGKKEYGDPGRIYNTVLVIHLLLAALLVVVGETLGVYYIDNYLNIEPNRIVDARFILHLSIVTTALSVVTVPVNGLLIAKEKFLFLSVAETVNLLIKFGLILLLMKMSGNRLVYYAIFLAICQVLLPVTYQIYARVSFREIIRWKFNRIREDYKGIISFAWWIMLGAVALLGQVQGSALIINFFFGTILNASFGLANQVKVAVLQFTSTLRQAAIPQIMKNQETNEKRSISLVYAISRYSFLCMSVLVIPIMPNIDGLLRIWLGNPPEYTGIFIVFMLAGGLVSNLGAGFDASIQATGKIRKNQIGYCLINLSLLPIMYIMYKMGFPAYVNVVVMVLLSIITVIFQCHIMATISSFSLKEYFRLTIMPSLKVVIGSAPALYVFHFFIPQGNIATMLFMTGGVVWTLTAVYLWGTNEEEKNIIKKLFIKLIKRK